jgi:hypothetical protein
MEVDMRGAENDEAEMSFRRGYQQGAIQVFYSIERFLDPATREVLQAWIEKDVFMWQVKAMLAHPPNWRLNCKIWYLISRTGSDDDAHCGDIDDRSVRAFAVKPAPSARRDAALGLTARRGRANPATVPLMHSHAISVSRTIRLRGDAGGK